MRVVGKPDRRPDNPAVLLDLAVDYRIPVIGLREEAAEFLFRVIDEHRRQQLALVGDQDWLVVGEEFRKQAENEQDQEDPEDQ